MGDCSLIAGGEQVTFLAEGAMLRIDLGMLVVADVHWGKAAAFRAAGVPLPFGTTADTLLRLDRLIEKLAPAELLILGDLWHARAGRHARTVEEVAQWRERHAALSITLVRGNHDRHAGDPDIALGMVVVDEPLRSGSWDLRHHPLARGATSGRGFWVAGHLHPAVEIHGPPRDHMLLPCFHLRRDGLVLPAFGAFTGTSKVRVVEGDRVFVLVAGEVVEIGS